MTKLEKIDMLEKVFKFYCSYMKDKEINTVYGLLCFNEEFSRLQIKKLKKGFSFNNKKGLNIFKFTNRQIDSILYDVFYEISLNYPDVMK